MTQRQFLAAMMNWAADDFASWSQQDVTATLMLALGNAMRAAEIRAKLPFTTSYWLKTKVAGDN